LRSRIVDLTGFSMTFTYPDVSNSGQSTSLSFTLADLALFSFNTHAFTVDPAQGAATLDLIATHDFGFATPSSLCSGAAATLSPACNHVLGGTYPPETKANIAGTLAYSLSLPAVTLVSSVTDPPPVSTVPEPATLLLLGTGVSGILVTRGRRLIA
jgi:hypothetical protein